MSMSHEMIKAYVKNQLAKAVSGGIIKGKTTTDEGHEHKFAVAYDEINKRFVGETSFDGQGPHVHYIMASLFDVVHTHLNNDPQPRDDDEINIFVETANAPSNMRRIIEFYNLKAIRLNTSPSFPNEHIHTLVVRFAGHNVDKMGKKVEAGTLDFHKGKQYGDAMDKAKNKKQAAEAELKEILDRTIKSRKTVEKKLEKTKSTSQEKPEHDYESLAEKIVEQVRKNAQKAEKQLMERIKKRTDSKKEKKTKYE